jgi:hypothetical protein
MSTKNWKRARSRVLRVMMCRGACDASLSIVRRSRSAAGCGRALAAAARSKSVRGIPSYVRSMAGWHNLAAWYQERGEHGAAYLIAQELGPFDETGAGWDRKPEAFRAVVALLERDPEYVLACVLAWDEVGP